MEFKEMKNLSDEELKKMSEQNKERLRVLRFDLASGKVKNVREIRHIKKATAQIQTILNGRQDYGK